MSTRAERLVQTRVPLQTREALQKMAQAEGASVAQLVRRLLLQHAQKVEEHDGVTEEQRDLQEGSLGLVQSRLSTRVKDALTRRARAEGASVAHLVRRVLEEYVRSAIFAQEMAQLTREE